MRWCAVCVAAPASSSGTTGTTVIPVRLPLPRLWTTTTLRTTVSGTIPRDRSGSGGGGSWHQSGLVWCPTRYEPPDLIFNTTLWIFSLLFAGSGAKGGGDQAYLQGGDSLYLHSNLCIAFGVLLSGDRNVVDSNRGWITRVRRGFQRTQWTRSLLF